MDNRVKVVVEPVVRHLVNGAADQSARSVPFITREGRQMEVAEQ